MKSAELKSNVLLWLLSLTLAPAAILAQTAMPPVQYPPATSASTQSSASSSASPQRLTLPDAEALALKNNPQISVARLLSMASQQITRQVKSNYYPATYGSLTAVDANDGSRWAAGGLNNPVLYERFAGGVALGQMITDFGRTNNLVATAALRAKAADMNTAATAAQIKLAVDQAFYNSLQASAELQVADQTVKARQTVSDQVTALFNNKLRSQLDVSFANANLSQANLLLLDAQNNYQASLSVLSEILGFTGQQPFELVDTEAQLVPPNEAVAPLVDQAFSNRPEIAAQNFVFQASQRFQKAERDLLLPDIRVMGVVGGVPTGAKQLDNWYGAVGVNVNIPIFNGFLYPARSKEAALRSQAEQERLRDLKDRIANDVRTSWLNTQTAYSRIAVTQQFVDQTTLAVDLSQTRYQLGLASIVELSQAQLQQTEAQIQNAAAKYQYRISQAVLRFQIAAP